MTRTRFALFAVVAVALCAVLYLLNRDRSSLYLGGTTELPSLTLFPFPFEELASIEIAYPSHEPIQIGKIEGGWRVKTPQGPRPLDDRKETLLLYPDGRTMTPELSGPIAAVPMGSNAERHAEFGFDGFSPTISLGNKSGAAADPFMLSLAPAPDKKSSFVKRPGSEHVFSVPLRLQDNFQGTEVIDWRRREIFPEMREDRIGRIDVDDKARPHYFFSLRRTGEKAFKIITNDGEEAAAYGNVLRLLTAIARARAEQFPADAQEPWPDDDRSTLRITVWDVEENELGWLELNRSYASSGKRLARSSTLQDIFLLESQETLIRGPRPYFSRRDR